MSKLACKCGNIIPDQTDNLPYKGRILRDQRADLGDTTANSVAGYMKAKLLRTEREWVSARFGEEYAQLELDDASIIHDLITSSFAPGIVLDIYQCEHCQRVLIEDRHKPNHFFSFAPEDSNATNILRVRD